MPTSQAKILAAALDVVLDTPIPYEVLRSMALEYQDDWGGLDASEQNDILHDCRKLVIVFLEAMKHTPRAKGS